MTEETRVPPIGLLGPSSAFNLAQNEANTLTLGYWEELGIEVQHEEYADFASFTGAVEEEHWDAASGGYIGTIFRIDPDLLLGRPLLCDEPANYGDYCFEEYDEAVESQKSAFDQQERQSFVHRAQELQALDIPLVASYHPQESYIWNSNAYGNTVVSVGSGLDNLWNVMEAEPLGDDATYRIGQLGQWSTINPLGADVLPEAELNMVWDTLAKIGPEGDIVPWAAESWTAIDETTIEVTLRDDLRFHDGEDVLADDVAFTYEYIRDWEVGYYTGLLELMESAEVVDDRTVRFHLTEPSSTFTTLGITIIPILPMHIWDGLVEREGLEHPRDWTESQMIGSGPWIVSTVNPAEAVELVRNDDHFNPPVSEAHQLRFFAESQGLFNALQAGDIYFHRAGQLGASAIEAAEGQDNLSVGSQPGITVRWMAFSFRDGSPFRDFHFRHALAHTFDYPTFIDAINRGLADPGTGTIGPGNEFWHADHISFEEQNDAANWHAFDMELARQILADAGYRWDEDGQLHFPENYEPQLHYDG